MSANADTVNDFFGKLGAIYGRLNLISKPMQLFNCDEMGISVVHKHTCQPHQCLCRDIHIQKVGFQGKNRDIIFNKSLRNIIMNVLNNEPYYIVQLHF